MTKAAQSTYLFLLVRQSVALRREAAERLRSLGARVVAQYGAVAIEASATVQQADAAMEAGFFAARLSGPMSRENMTKLDDEQRKIVTQWNTRFTPSYRELAKDQTNVGKSWSGDKKLGEPFPYSAIDAEVFLELLERYEKESGKRLREPPPKKASRAKGQSKRMTPDEFVHYERELAKKYKDATLAYHLSRLAFRLGPEYYALIGRLPRDLLDILVDLFLIEATCWRMDGEIAVGIIFVESSRDKGPKFGTTERNEICQRILDGHTWLASQHPTGNLSFVYDTQFVKIDVANESGDPQENYWRDPGMGQVNYNGTTYSADLAGVRAYREDMRQANWSAHAIAIFVTPYNNWWHAYAGGGKITLANKDNWEHWGRGAIDMITAHETSHLFGSSDEYGGDNGGTPCSSCTTTHGCDKLPNGNCAACAHPHQDCVMDANSRRLCAYTKGHIGWGHLFVETTTADVRWASTDDDVWLDIGDRTFVLDTSDHDDRERNNCEAYAFYEPDLARDAIKQVLIRKSEDGIGGGWKLKRVRLWLHGDLVCDQDNINQWLEDEHRWWVGCINDPNIVNSLSVRISTADVRWASTDDDVTLTLAGRSWNLDTSGNDFERGNNDTFNLDPGTGLYVSDIHSVQIHKSSDGIGGGWKLKGVRLTVNGSTIYSNQSINKWLEDDDRDWSDSF